MVQTTLSEKNKNSKFRKNFKKIKFSKSKNEKFQKIKIPVIYTRMHTRAREKNTENGMFLCMCDAIKYQTMPFKGIFSPVESILWFFPYKLPQDKRKRLRTL